MQRIRPQRAGFVAATAFHHHHRHAGLLNGLRQRDGASIQLDRERQPARFQRLESVRRGNAVAERLPGDNRQASLHIVRQRRHDGQQSPHGVRGIRVAHPGARTQHEQAE